MSYSWAIGIFGAIIAIINVYYLLMKDTVNKKETEIAEILKIIESAMQEAIDNCYNDDKQNNKVDLKRLDIYLAKLEIVPNFRIIIENNLESKILEFSLALSDFKTGSKKREDLLGAYKEILEYIYKIEASSLKYLYFLMYKKSFKKKTSLCKNFKIFFCKILNKMIF